MLPLGTEVVCWYSELESEDVVQIMTDKLPAGGPSVSRWTLIFIVHVYEMETIHFTSGPENKVRSIRRKKHECFG